MFIRPIIGHDIAQEKGKPDTQLDPPASGFRLGRLCYNFPPRLPVKTTAH